MKSLQEENKTFKTDKSRFQELLSELKWLQPQSGSRPSYLQCSLVGGQCFGGAAPWRVMDIHLPTHFSASILISLKWINRNNLRQGLFTHNPADIGDHHVFSLGPGHSITIVTRISILCDFCDTVTWLDEERTIRN